jgi:glucose/arabinose dehydrogenase
MQVNGSGVAVTLPGNCVGSYAVATATATAAQTINVLKKAVGSTTLTTVGTIAFAAGASSGTFSTTSGAAVTFNPGEAMYVQVGSSADATLANVAISLFLTY